MSWNEDSRVKLPALLHACKLGYEYISIKKTSHEIDPETNIFKDIFYESIKKINQNKTERDVINKYKSISISLANDDLGKEFYEMLINQSDIKLIDFENIEQNTFNVVTELTFKNGEDEFRPDITFLINGLPLIILEVKKPNNPEGILAERLRINKRFQNKKFKKFINIFQKLIFSNNMDYDESMGMLQGAFYAASTFKNDVKLNFFREEDLNFKPKFQNLSDEIEDKILKDNNLFSIKHSPEYITNKSIFSPTNKILSSLVSKDRLMFFIQFGIAYVKKKSNFEKHIMRYPQFFASQSIIKTLNSDIKKGIIWHTQGSGKTALSYYATQFLSDYFNKKNIVTKFYFIVDRLDLQTQAQIEFSNRGLTVNILDNKKSLLEDFKKTKSINNFRGKDEITVINIQKFAEDKNEIKHNDYNIKVQRIYFLDEVHRSYDPNGSFLANLINSDRDAILFGLTGTPLIKSNRKTKDTFGNYIHKYYYNDSIKDGYTLKLLREEIDGTYKKQLSDIIKNSVVTKGSVERKDVYSSDKFVNKLLEYIINDINQSVVRFNEKFGSMVVCDSSDQAKNLYSKFLENYSNSNAKNENSLSAKLILHDVDDIEERKKYIKDFKRGDVNILFVYNMLLTGFDAPLLKKLYVGRKIKDHNLLQMLTRVNRPYKNFKYGYVVDFADISEEFDKINKAYFNELQEELGDEFKNYSNLFENKENIEKEILNIKNSLMMYDLENKENFSKQISEIQDRKELSLIKNSLISAKNLYNLIRLYDHPDLLDKLDFKKLNILLNETTRHLSLINLKEALSKKEDNIGLVNIALENIDFFFKKVGEEELVIADKLREKIIKTNRSLEKNFDKKDPEYILLYEELKRLFKKKNFEEMSNSEMNTDIVSYEKLYIKSKEINRKNDLINLKYNNDQKFTRIHKRVLEMKKYEEYKPSLFDILNDVKDAIDEHSLNNNEILKNENYFKQVTMPIIIQKFEITSKENINYEDAEYLNSIVVNEYINEYQQMN
tara:strand:- start:2758 stop:5769 length:3012 start_codon:yes stop_codon:yes gene_type:complete